MALKGTGHKLDLCPDYVNFCTTNRVKVNMYLVFVCLTESYMYVSGVNISYLLISVSPLWVYKRKAL